MPRLSSSRKPAALRISAKTKPTRKARFIPEIASRCASELSRSATTVSWLMPDRSPVIDPAAKAPASPGIAARIAADR